MVLTPGTRTIIIRVGSFLLGGGLLFLALRNVDFGRVWEALAAGNYWWLIPMVVVTLLSHWLRAMRWSIMLDALPERRDSKEKVSVWIAFVSIMIGYMANYAGPRLGEVIRTGSESSHEGLRFSSVLGTVVTDRILDVFVLLLALSTLPLIYQERIPDLVDMLLGPTVQWTIDVNKVLVVLVILSAVGVALLLFRSVRHRKGGKGRIRAIVASFREGLMSVLNTGKSTSIVLLTLAIWACYAMMAWLPFLLLGQASAFGIGPIDAWGLMVLGAIGVAIPSPGGIGTYHFVTIASLGLLHGMPEAEAATYALLAHTGQMILYILVGFSGFLYLGTTASRHVRGGEIPHRDTRP